MSERVAGAVDSHGRAVARKRAVTPRQAASLAWEAEALAAAQHPGVVEVLATKTDDAGLVELTTAYAGTQSLATCPPPSLGQVAAVCAALASTLADIHGLGVVHGRVEPSHVLVGPGGRPVLCGFSGATVRRRAAPPTSEVTAEFADPALTADTPLDPTCDVYGLGAVLSFLLRGGGRRSPHAGRHRVSALVGSLRDSSRRRALVGIAERAMRPEPGLRPTATEMAKAIHDAAPSARVGAPAATVAARPPSTERRLPWRLAAAGICGLALVAFAWMKLGSSTSGDAPRTDEAAQRAVPAPAANSIPDATAAIATGPQPVVVGGNFVEVGGDRYEVGEPGDQILLGDWDCDGVITPALFRPSTGEAFVFNSWAQDGRDLTVRAAAQVSDAVRAVGDDRDGDGCHRLVVEQADGEHVEVNG